MDVWRVVAERKIEEAIEEGAFDNLPGRGRPVDLTEDPFVDPSLRMGYRLLRNNGFAPPWIEEGKEIEAELRRMRAALEAGEEACGRFRRDAAAINRRIALYNLKAPTSSAHKCYVDAEREIAAFKASA
jgi:DnaJ family protein C protein 28